MPPQVRKKSAKASWQNLPWILGTLSGWGAQICDIVLRLGQNEPVVEVIQHVDSHLSQWGKSRIHALRKSAGSQAQPKGEGRVLISHSLEGESQEPPVVGGYLDVKVSIFQIQRK